MKKLNYLLSITLLSFLVSCGGGENQDDSNSVSLTIESQLGELGNYITISDSEVIVKLVDEKVNGEEGKSIVASVAVMVNKGVASDGLYGLEAIVLDEDHIEIASLPSFDMDSEWISGNEGYHNILTVGNTRAQLKYPFKWDDEHKQQWEKILTQGKYLVLKPDQGDKFAPYNTGSENYTSSSESYDYNSVTTAGDDEDDDELSVASDTNFDEFLAAYEKYINKFISIQQKAKTGDYSAITEAASLLQDAQEYGEKIQNMSGNLTPSQLVKFQKLQQKFINASL